MLAISIDGAMYGFCYSPLGLLSANAQWMAEGAPLKTGVHLYESNEEKWVTIQWPAHLWWVRFLLVGHHLFQGTRHERTCDYQNTSQFLAWWLCNTPLAERNRFFRSPDIPVLLRSIRHRTSLNQHSWLHGHHGLLHAIQRIYKEVRSINPSVLRPCQDHNSDQWQYSNTHSSQRFRELLQLMEQPVTPAFVIPFFLFEKELLSRYGCLASEAMASKNSTQVSLPFKLHGATIVRYRELGCSILDFDNERYIALSLVEQTWSSFAGALCKLMKHAEVVLLDAPVPVRRRVHLGIQGLLEDGNHCSWVVDAAATITNLQEELGVVATTSKYYQSVPGQQILVVDGMHRLGLRQQVELIQHAANTPSIRVVVLGGDTTGKGLSRGRALDGWTLCCHAVRLRGDHLEYLDQLDSTAWSARVKQLFQHVQPSGCLTVWLGMKGHAPVTNRVYLIHQICRVPTHGVRMLREHGCDHRC